MSRLAHAFLLSVAASFGCGSVPPMGPADNFVSTESAQTYFRIETVASDLDVPWAFAWLPNGNMLFTERKGRVRIIENRTLRREPVFTVPDVEPSGESGLMDITLHPDFAGNSFVYLAYAYNNEGKKVKVVRYKYSNSTFEDATVVIQDIPGAPNHAGMRADFGPDGKLYITTGDATEGELAQKMDSLAGKTLRLNDDGSVPLDNPFVKRTGVRPEIWTLGHRNSQGIAWQPGSNLMFQTEHGPSGGDGPGGGDEVNIVEKGKNYGWPTIHHTESKPGLVAPLLEYTPACAPGSAMFYTGEIFAELKGSLLFGCLRGARITRVKLDGRKVVGQESFMVNKVGRIREMAQGPDGYIYFSTSNRDGRGSPIPSDDRIMRLVPVA